MTWRSALAVVAITAVLLVSAFYLMFHAGFFMHGDP